jgi:prephenate dehydrogenase
VNMLEDGFSLEDSIIVIVGLGLMGGSIALAFKGHCRALYGIDSDPVTLELALARKIVDRAEVDPARLLPQADLVVLATPVPIILALLQQIPDLMPNRCIILDLGSTKRLIVEAMSRLPERFDPIGGHPICGKEKLSLENAEGHLYQSAPFVLTALQRSSFRARNAVEQIVHTIGARAIWMDASEHDRVLALTSHLPFLLSSALASVLAPAPATAAAQEVAILAGPGLRSASRLAGTPSSMMLGVLETNRENVLAALDLLRNELGAFEAALSSGDSDNLHLLLDRSRAVYQTFA